MRRDDWETPIKLFEFLHGLFQFEIDAAASKENALLPRYWTEEDNALEQDWSGKRIFCNPPYSLSAQFADKFFDAETGTGVMLLPVRSDRLWFQRLLHQPSTATCWITGRLKFGDKAGSAFMYSVLFWRGQIGLPRSMQAGQFNFDGKGDART